MEFSYDTADNGGVFVGLSGWSMRKTGKFFLPPEATSRRFNVRQKTESQRKQEERERAARKSALPLFLRDPQSATVKELLKAVDAEPKGFPTKATAVLTANAIVARKELQRRGVEI